MIARSLVFVFALLILACSNTAGDGAGAHPPGPETDDGPHVVSTDRSVEIDGTPFDFLNLPATCSPTEAALAELARQASDLSSVREGAVTCLPSEEFFSLEVAVDTGAPQHRKLAILADGRVLGQGDARIRYGNLYRERWGVAYVELAHQYEVEDPSAVRQFQVLGVNLTGEFDREWILDVDAGARVGDCSCFAFVTTTLTQAVEELAMNPAVGIVGFYDNDRSGGEESTPQNSASHSRSAELFNQASPPRSGTLIAVALDEWAQGAEGNNGPVRCGLYEQHEAFEFTSGLAYMSAPTSCSTDAECIPEALACGGITECIDGYCTGGHATQVASRVSASDDGEQWHAAGAALFLLNEDEPGGAVRLNWVQTKGIRIVNQSFSTDLDDVYGLYLTKHSAQDLAAREGGVTLIRSTGNAGQEICDGLGAQTAACPSPNSVCVGGSYSQVHGSFFKREFFFGHTQWLNRHPGSEEPDVVSEALCVRAAGLGSPTDWSARPCGLDVCDGEGGLNGTSFAAPVVTGLAALYAECLLAQGWEQIEPHVFRSLIRTAAVPAAGLRTTVPPESPSSLNDYFYPTPGLGPDAMAGTGVADAGMIRAICTPGWFGLDESLVNDFETDEPGVYLRVAVGALDNDNLGAWEDPPAYFGGLKDDDLDDANEDNSGDSSEDDYRTYPTALSASEIDDVVTIFRAVDIHAGDRLRASVSMLNCGDMSPLPGEDFDVFACSDVLKTCYAASQSSQDVDEGFDIVFDDDVPDIHVRVSRGASGSRCDMGGSRWDAEPVAWTLAFWTLGGPAAVVK